MTTRIAVVGAGAFGRQHLDALTRAEDVQVTSVVSTEGAREVAKTYGVPHATTDLAETLADRDVDAVILCTPSPLHSAQAIAALRAGKHVQVEIPLAESWAAAEAVDRVQRETGLVCMVGHTRRYNPSHRWINRRVLDGELTLQQLAVQTYFLRRSNINALGQPRTWTDNLLWHHAAHTVDLFRHQTGQEIVRAGVLAGPPHPELGIPMDMSIQLLAAGGAICTLSLSFNNDGPQGTVFRYICDNGTYVGRYDELVTGDGKPVEIEESTSGVELQDREFVAAIRDGREPLTSVAEVLPSYRVLAGLARQY